MSKKSDLRGKNILQIINKVEKIKVIDLAKQLNVTPETIRKDLNDLASENLIIREHGYAYKPSITVESNVELKTRENNENKKKVTLEAFKRIESGQTVFLDSGSTILTALDALQNRKDITIVTNSILIAYHCCDMDLNIILAGGLLFNIGRRTYGHFATEIIDQLNIDLCIMGTDSFIEKSHGFTSFSVDELGFKRHILNQSTKKIAVCDSSKVNNLKNVAPYSFCKFNEFDELITNKLTPSQYEVVKNMKKVTQV